MDFTGKRVCHRTLGEGKIIRQEGNIIWARFPGRADAMRFSMPGCFESFLTLPDAEAKVAAQRELEEKKRLQLRAEEEEHRREDALRPSIRAIPLSGAKFPSVPVYRDMASFFAAQERALEEEIRAMQCNSKNQRISIRNGERMERRGDLFVYAFESETELNLPDGIPLRLWRGRMEWKGTLLGCDDVTIYIAVEADLGERVESMEFSAEAWQLLRFLNNHLAELCDAPSALVRSLVLDGRRMDLCTEEIRTGQEQALRMVLAQTISFLWGPPGTGKTHTLAKIALQFLARKKRVLMLSYSNISVDGAALRVLSMDVHPVPGKIVRYGYPRDQRVSEHEYLNSYNLVMRRHPDLLAERQALLVERRGLSAVNRRSLEIRERLQEIHDQLREEEAAAVRQAAFVATTVSKAVIDANLYRGKFDVVIFDEASMALVPQLVFAASLAKERFICIGDFAQLPPIVQSGSDSTLNVDIFRFCGIAEAVARGQGHR